VREGWFPGSGEAIGTSTGVQKRNNGVSHPKPDPFQAVRKKGVHDRGGRRKNGHRTRLSKPALSETARVQVRRWQVDGGGILRVPNKKYAGGGIATKRRG